jgi:hypothetical protein
MQGHFIYTKIHNVGQHVYTVRHLYPGKKGGLGFLVANFEEIIFQKENRKHGRQNSHYIGVLIYKTTLHYYHIYKCNVINTEVLVIFF